MKAIDIVNEILFEAEEEETSSEEDIKKNKGIIVFDIDDTIVKAKNLRIKSKDGEKELTPTEFAQLSNEEKNKDWDFSDFRNFDKLFSSIVTGTPVIGNLKMLDSYYNKGWDIGFLTARGVEAANKKAIVQWLKIRDKIDNKLKAIQPSRIKFFAAVNDPARLKETGGMTPGAAKKYYLNKLKEKYEVVKFVDDDETFIKKAKEVLPAKDVIKARIK